MRNPSGAVLLAVAALASQHSFAATDGFDKIDLLWKARGLQAKERIEKLQKALNRNETGPTQKQKCAKVLEIAYATFATPGMAEFAVKQNGDRRTYWVLFIPTSGNADVVAQIGYNFDKNSLRPTGVRIVGLKGEDAEVVLIPDAPNTFSMRVDGCTYIFKTLDPFSPELLTSK